MQRLTRTEKARAKRKKKRKEGLIIFRYAADVFRIFDTLYRFFRLML